jgi:hypothetical protein
VRHPLRSAKALFTSKWFAIGMGVAVGAWILHVAAMAIAPISVVQAVLSGGVVLLAVMAERLFGFEVGPRQWLGVGFTALGLFALVLTLPHSTGAHSHFSLTGMIAFEGGLVGVGALLIMGKHIGGPAEHHGVMLGAPRACCSGVRHLDQGHHRPRRPVRRRRLPHPVAPRRRGRLGRRLLRLRPRPPGRRRRPGDRVHGTAANVATIAGGIIVFGDPLPGDALGVIVQVAAFTVICVAAALTPAPIRAAESTAPAAA